MLGYTEFKKKFIGGRGYEWFGRCGGGIRMECGMLAFATGLEVKTTSLPEFRFDYKCVHKSKTSRQKAYASVRAFMT